MTAARTGIVHVHSDYSHDGRDTLESLVVLARRRGIGFVGLTDHAEDFSEARYAELCERSAALSQGGVQLVAGLEFRFAGFPGLHLLAVGLSGWIAPRSPAEFIELARGRCGLTVWAHPVLARWSAPAEVLAGIDAVEVWNATYNTRYLPDPRAIRILQDLRMHRPDVVALAGLDQHDASNDREIRVVLPEVVADPIASLRSGRFSNRGRTMAFDSSATIAASHLTMLAAARWMFDRVERVHERVGQARRHRAGAR